jgi:drug/metabolite transporter (DMT)-like permease
MTKLLLILIIGLIFEATGVVLLKKGMNQIGEPKRMEVSEVIRLVKAGITNSSILAGVFFEALFFATLLILMSKSDISFLWPLTALSFVMTTFAAVLFLREQVSPLRWAGVIFIVIGAALISYSEQTKKESAPAIRVAAPNNG